MDNKNIILAIVLITLIIFTIYIYHKFYKFYRPIYFNSCYIRSNIRKYIKKSKPTDDLLQIKNTQPSLFQTYYDKSKIPSEVYYNIQKYASEYKHVILDDNELEQFLKTHFKNNIVQTFKSLKMGAHKADLARYCLLYIHGGVYMDIKVELIKPLSSIFNKGEDVFYSVISSHSDHIHQGIIKSPPKNPLFLSLIDYIVKTPNPFSYIDYCRDLYIQLFRDIYIQEGFQVGISGRKYYLFKEKCSTTDFYNCYDGFDRYGMCCFVWDGNIGIIKSRRSSFGKTW
jgi:hypothetical protein